MPEKCPFCSIIEDDAESRILEQNELAVSMYDGYPVNNGHILLIPKRHVGSFFEVSDDERNALFSLLDLAKSNLDKEFSPASYNIGINDGVAAGQTVPHLHIHLIPRYEGDIEDPRGGIRWIIPDKAKYW
jgi:diadenosine tetraphosphate (Ap4A) HIT family hydrolase